jgi:hypothetical protein
VHGVLVVAVVVTMAMQPLLEEVAEVVVLHKPTTLQLRPDKTTTS